MFQFGEVYQPALLDDNLDTSGKLIHAGGFRAI
jgi:hypothetical protein